MVMNLLRNTFSLCDILPGKKTLLGTVLCVWIWPAELGRFLYYTVAKTVRENIPLKPNGQEILLQRSMNWSQYRVVNPQRSLWITNRYIILSDTHTEKNRLFELMVLKPVHSTAELHNALSKINNKWANKCLDGLVSWPWSCHPWLTNPDHLILPDRRVWNWN